MRKMVAVIVMLVGLGAMIAPQCFGLSISETNESTMTTGSSIYSVGSAVAPSASFLLEDEGNSGRHQDCNNTGSSNHSCHHQCHFGHCGIVANQTKVLSHLSGSQHGGLIMSLTLKSFSANLFRPPII